MEEKASNAMLVAIVAVVAIVGLVMLYSNNKEVSSVGARESPLVGQAIDACRDSDGNGPTVYGGVSPLGTNAVYSDYCRDSSTVYEMTCGLRGERISTAVTCSVGYSCFTSRNQVFILGSRVTAGRCARRCADADGDGYQNPTSPSGCELTSAFSDCNDADPAIRPGATEICDNRDNNCDLAIDNGCDDDDDNYCDSGMAKAAGVLVTTCTGTPQAAARGNDCNDVNVAIHPSAVEVCGNGVDEDCSGADQVCAIVCTDADGDGYQNPASPPGCTLGTQADCNDANRAINPGTRESCDNIDNNCASGIDEGCDDDNDDYCDAAMPYVGASTCSRGGEDCNDVNAAIRPNAVEVCGNGVDDNCNGIIDDACPPASPEICDNIDNDYDGVVDNGCDDDNDNYCDAGMSKAVGLFVSTCSWTRAAASRGDDCNDNNPSIHLGAFDNSCDGIDQDCSGRDGIAYESCDDIDNDCNGVMDDYAGGPADSACPTCRDDDGNNPLYGSFAVWGFPPNPPNPEFVVYDTCVDGIQLNESICVSYRYGGNMAGAAFVDCAASGRRCVRAGGGDYCG